MAGFELDAREAWARGADAYIHFVESGADYYRHLVHGPGLLAACGDVRGTRALDLGCGQGYFTRLLAGAGAAVTGVDLCDALLARAAELESAAPLGVTYRTLDAERVADALGAGRFDLVTGCMSLQDFADPGAALAAAAGVLRPGGRAVFSVPHPCTDMPHREWQRDGGGRKVALGLDRYFETGPAVCRWDMPRLKSHWSTPYHRHTLTEWCGLIQAAGLAIGGLAEPRPTAEQVARRPELEDCARVPYFLIFQLYRPQALAARSERW